MSRSSSAAATEPHAPASAVAGFLGRQTNGPSDTRFWGSLDDELDQLGVPPGRHVDGCTAVPGIAASLNRVAVCAHLQGFDDLAAIVTCRLLDDLSTVGCPCARICEVQPHVNLARLARATGDARALDRAVVALTDAVARAERIDPRRLPPPLRRDLDGRLLRSMARTVPDLERAKLAWARRDVAGALHLASRAVGESGSSTELAARCLIALGRPDQALALCITHVPTYGWLRHYAGIALLDGGRPEDAHAVLRAALPTTALPALRAAMALLDHGLGDDATRLATSVASSAAAAAEELPLLCAGAFLTHHDLSVDAVDVALLDAVADVASRSRHHEAVTLLAPLPASRVSQARVRTQQIADRFDGTIRTHAPPA